MYSNIAAQLARYLLQIKAIQLNTQTPFTWTSGWRSPVYCDNRKLLSYPEVRNFVRDGLTALVRKAFPEGKCIAGVATAGIPHGALIADVMQLPFIYVRSKPKEHGMKNMIEGDLTPGTKVVVVEDTISTGKSSLQAVADLRQAGAEVIGMVAIYNYGFDVTTDRFREAGVPLFTLTDYPALIRAATEEGYIGPEAMQTLTDWRSDPANWKK
jgi:orotate phosphoribosyltransferase